MHEANKVTVGRKLLACEGSGPDEGGRGVVERDEPKVVCGGLGAAENCVGTMCDEDGVVSEGNGATDMSEDGEANERGREVGVTKEVDR